MRLMWPLVKMSLMPLGRETFCDYVSKMPLKDSETLEMCGIKFPKCLCVFLGTDSTWGEGYMFNRKMIEIEEIFCFRVKKTQR